MQEERLNSNLLEQVEAHCTAILTAGRCKRLPFHNFDHTAHVVAAVQDISAAEGISKHDRTLVIIAAWFHDTGQSVRTDGHEQESIRLATDFLIQLGCTTDLIDNVSECIKATKMQQQPASRLATILCDADLYHLSEPDLLERQNWLRQELALFAGQTYTDKEWHTLNLAFLQQHHYFTNYGRQALQMRQQENEKMIMQQLDELG